jgi:hypothetical protein
MGVSLWKTPQKKKLAAEVPPATAARAMEIW